MIGECPCLIELVKLLFEILYTTSPELFVFSSAYLIALNQWRIVCFLLQLI